jgi:excisionase family DNA binding protein
MLWWGDASEGPLPPDGIRMIGEPAMKMIFTTGQVAKICKVAPRTVSKWFDSGRLRGYRIPGSQDRRIPREHLIRFLKEHGMPLGELEDEAVGKILVVGADQLIRANLRETLSPESFKLEYANSGFEAGIQAESVHPDCVVVDFMMGRNESILIAQNLRKNSEYTDVVLIGLLSDEDSASGFDRSVFNETFRKPFDVALLAERIKTLVSRKKQLV